MNVMDILKADHSRVEKLFDELDSAGDFYSKQEIFQKIRHELDLMIYLKETYFYPLFEEKSGFGDYVDRAFEDHQEIKVLLEEMDGLEEEDEFEDRFTELADCVQGHVEMEEEEIFPRVENVLTANELEQLGNSLEDAKRSSEVAA